MLDLPRPTLHRRRLRRSLPTIHFSQFQPVTVMKLRIRSSAHFTDQNRRRLHRSLPKFLAELFNRSLSSGSFPEAFKAAYTTPLLKESDIDPISSLSVASKLQELLPALHSCWITCICPSLACFHGFSLHIAPVTPQRPQW